MISSVELGDTLSTIESGAFKDCDHLTRITLGRGITNIEETAFTGCTEIRRITSRALNPPTVYRNTFADVDDDITVTVPCIAVDAYTEAPYWSHFNNIEGHFDWFFSATSGNLSQGSVTVVNTPTCENLQAQILANPTFGYHFARWNDGNTDNPRFVTVTQDTIIVAEFVMDTFYITVTASGDCGTAEGGGRFVYGDTATLTATPLSDDCHFDHWSDGSTENPYRLAVAADAELIAYFASDTPQGIEDAVEIKTQVSVQGRGIVVGGTDGLPVSLYDIQGRIIATRQVCGDNAVKFTVPATGIYMLRIGNRPAQRIAVLR